MKVGDLVTLSSYCLQTAPMWTWREKVWIQKKPLIGLVVKIEDNPFIRKNTSENEKKYYFVRWIKEGPAGRWNSSSLRVARPYQTAYFYRNDLKFVK